MSDDAARVLRETLEQMANACSVDMELWDKHANAVLTAAARIEALVKEMDEALTAHAQELKSRYAAEAERDALCRERDEAMIELNEKDARIVALATELCGANAELTAIRRGEG